MKHLNTLLLSSALILTMSGCGDNDAASSVEKQKSQVPQTTLVEGKTTLAFARVCVDENSNTRCDEEEVQTKSSAKGDYVLELDYLLDDGSKILAEDGYNLVLEENNLNRFRFSSFYNEEERVHNINTVTSLLTANTQSAKETLAEALSLDVETLLEDPIALASDDDRLFLTARGIEDGYRQQALAHNTTKAAKHSPSRAAQKDSYTTPALEDSLSFLEDGTFLNFNIAEYFLRLELKIKDFFSDIRNLIASQLGFEKLSDVEREQLNGIWLVQDENISDSCVVIDNQDKIITYKNDSSEALSIYFSESTSTLSILIGWQVASELQVSSIDYDTLNVTNPKKEGTDYTFIRYNDLESCQSMLTEEEPPVVEAPMTVAHLNALKGKFDIVLPVGVTYKNLKVNYTNVFGKKERFDIAADGTFDFVSTKKSEDILLLKGHDTTTINNVNMVLPDSVSLILEMSLYQEGVQGYKKINIKKMINIYDIQDDGNVTSFDMGTVALPIGEVNVCINNYDYDVIGGITYINDLGLNEETTNTDKINFFVEIDNTEHFVALLSPRAKDYALIRYVAKAENLDMRNSCVDLIRPDEMNVSMSVVKSYDTNKSDIVFSSMFADEISANSHTVNANKTEVTETFAVDKIGYYSLEVRNNTGKQGYLTDKAVTLNVFGNDYTITPEFITSEYTYIASIAFYNNNLVFILSSDDKLIEIIEVK